MEIQHAATHPPKTSRKPLAVYQAIFDVPAKRWVTEVRDWKSKLAEAAGKGEKLPVAARIEDRLVYGERLARRLRRVHSSSA